MKYINYILYKKYIYKKEIIIDISTIILIKVKH